MISTRIISTCILLALSISVVCADEVRHHTFAGSEISSLTLDVRVGSIVISPSTSGDIEVELRIEESGGLGWFSSKPDIADMDLESRVRRNQLSLSLDEKDITTDWIIKVPPLANLEIDLGVGAVEIEDLGTAMEIDVGVGSVEIDTPLSSAGHISLSVGVGDTTVRGASEQNSRRAIVSSETDAEGNGSNDIQVDVGVGDVVVRLD